MRSNSHREAAAWAVMAAAEVTTAAQAGMFADTVPSAGAARRAGPAIHIRRP
jgi:hypothetical protein